MRKNGWYAEVVLASEVEELENDELSTGEAGFLSGYEEEEEEF